jgi:alkanesulfonate monooxygenase SsuD/methylene tetrahydromethanopterin reductase-like flavin-dependent oxidoreductase (luciferase family)
VSGSREETETLRIGLTLPSFRDDPEPAFAVAAAAEAAGLDAVFAYDHLFRRAADGTRRPAIELLTLMGAVAADTSRIAIGALVARATVRAPAVLAHGFDTVARIAGPDRVIAGVGAGDGESREENESFGLGFGSVQDRIAVLRDAVGVVRDRGYPVWVGGRDPAVREIAAAWADGWNRWGTGLGPTKFGAQAADLRIAAARAPFTISWGGLVVLGADERDAAAKSRRLTPGPHVIVGGPERVADALRDYADAGADWVIIGPVDSSDPENADMLGELVSPLLRG